MCLEYINLEAPSKIAWIVQAIETRGEGYKDLN